MQTPAGNRHISGINYRSACLGLLEGARRSGRDINLILAEAGLDAPQAIGQRVNAHQFVRLLRATRVALDDEFFGLTEHRAKQGTTALLIDLSLGCLTLGAAIEQIINFMRVVTDDLELSCELSDEDFIFSVSLQRPDLDPTGFLVDFWLLWLYRIFSWITDTDIPVKQVKTSSQIVQQESLLRIIRSEHLPGHDRNALVISQKYSSLPVLRTRQEWHAHVDQMIRHGILDWPSGDKTFAHKVKALLLQALAGRQALPKLHDIADTLCLTAQTLHRNLQHEGTGYQRILDDLRRDFAIELLTRQHLSVAEVAQLLGFSEARSFSRAFKSWTGSNPSSLLQSSP